MYAPNILWLDLETTGLEAKEDYILEAAAILTTAQGEEIAPRFHRVCEIERPSHAYDRIQTNPVVLRMHVQNGLLDECLGSIYSRHALSGDLSAWLKGSGVDRPVLGGNSVSFDRGFLALHCRGFAKLLHYRTVDVTSMQIAYAAAGVDVPDCVVEGAPHRAMPDIERSLATYKWMLANIAGVECDQ